MAVLAVRERVKWARIILEEDRRTSVIAGGRIFLVLLLLVPRQNWLAWADKLHQSSSFKLH